MNLRINIKFVSVVLGVILWLYVNIVISPVVRRTIKTPIEFRNVPPKIRIQPQKFEAEIVLNGTRRDFIFAVKDSIQASVDLYAMRPGMAYFPLKVTTPSGLSVVAMRPAQIEISGEALVSRKFQVMIDLKGQVAEGFIHEAPIATPTEVLVEGPKELVEKITSCQVSLPIAEYKNSISESKKIVAFGPDGEIERGLKFYPEKADIAVTVKAGYPDRNVTVLPQFINKTPEGLKLENYTVTPSEISVSGPFRVLEQLQNIRTSPIDLSLLRSNSTIIALLDPPPYENVKIAGSNTVSLQITLTPMPMTRNFNGLPLIMKSHQNQHCSVTPASFTLVLKGFLDDLNKVPLSNLSVTVDTRSMSPGTYTIPLQIPGDLPPKVEVLEIIPPKVQILVLPVIAPVASGSETPEK